MLLELDPSSDASVAAARAALVEKVGEEPGVLYAICNNAGIAGGAPSEIFDVNVVCNKGRYESICPWA